MVVFVNIVVLMVGLMRGWPWSGFKVSKYNWRVMLTVGEVLV